jgi:hypothetical protein
MVGDKSDGASCGHFIEIGKTSALGKVLRLLLDHKDSCRLRLELFWLPMCWIKKRLCP